MGDVYVAAFDRDDDALRFAGVIVGEYHFAVDVFELADNAVSRSGDTLVPIAGSSGDFISGHRSGVRADRSVRAPSRANRQHSERVLEPQFHEADGEVGDVDTDPCPAQLLRRREGCFLEHC